MSHLNLINKKKMHYQNLNIKLCLVFLNIKINKNHKKFWYNSKFIWFYLFFMFKKTHENLK